MINGILNIYKEAGYTSHDVVARLRGIVGQKKIGHTGTLDPDAEGVLPVCLGKATKACGLLTDRKKEYKAVLLLGKTTDTQDITGQVLGERPVTVNEENIKEIIHGFQGIYHQIPPMYSAIKQGGKKLYQLAREGRVVDRRARELWIYEIEILAIEMPRVHIRVLCSKGTYIRTLCHDIGEKAGCGACMESLLRTRSGDFILENSVKLDSIEEFMKEGRLLEVLFPTDQVFKELPGAVIKEEYNKVIYNGNSFLIKNIDKFNGSGISNNLEHNLEIQQESEYQKQVRVYDSNNNFVGIYSYNISKKRYEPVKMFW